jgi:uncharacterized protein
VRPPEKRRVLGWLALPLLLYGGALALLFVFQGRLLFINTRELYRDPSAMGWEYEDIELPVGNETTHAWWIPAPEPARGVFLFSHGNAGNIADRLESVSIIRGMGFDTLVYDYGGYGRSTGKPSEARCYADIRAMYRWLTETRGIPPERIVIFGRSLGAGPSIQLATEAPAAALIAESAFLSVPQMAQRLYPIFPGALLARHRFDNEAKIAGIRMPVLLIHSPDDTIIPYDHGRRLYDLAPQPKAFLQINGGHNEGFWQSGSLYTSGILDFLQSWLVTPKHEIVERDNE